MRTPWAHLAAAGGKHVVPMTTDTQAVRAAGAGVSAHSAVRSLPAAEREDPTAVLRAAHGATDGEVWHDVPVFVVQVPVCGGG
jgi:hypothetical protein